MDIRWLLRWLGVLKQSYVRCGQHACHPLVISATYLKTLMPRTRIRLGIVQSVEASRLQAPKIPRIDNASGRGLQEYWKRREGGGAGLRYVAYYINLTVCITNSDHFQPLLRSQVICHRAIYLGYSLPASYLPQRYIDVNASAFSCARPPMRWTELPRH